MQRAPDSKADYITTDGPSGMPCGLGVDSLRYPDRRLSHLHRVAQEGPCLRNLSVPFP
jgi:hypothetical protein